MKGEPLKERTSEKNEKAALISPTGTGITETVLRDAHQSLLATRMRTSDMLEMASELDRVGYWSLEVWGGATFDTCLRYLKEDPWERLRSLRKAIPNTRLQMLLRGQNLVGYRHYADDVVKKFIKRAVKNGVDVFRIFDALNDTRNLTTSIRAAKEAGGIVEAAICYTTSPVHTNETFADMAEKLANMGADTICLKDMAGLLTPEAAFNLISLLRERVDLPIHMHSHDSCGLASMSYLKGVEAGAGIIDTALSSLASGTSQPPTESLIAALEGTPFDTGLDLSLISEISERFRDIRKKYGRFESEHTVINTKILISQIPGGMMSNLAHQLKEQSAIDRMGEVLAEIPRVRKEMGYPPLVTPSSQVVGTQATLNVLTGERYKVITSETRNYFRNLYGTPPGPVDEEARRLAIGDEKPIDCRPADLLEPELDRMTREIDGKAHSIEDVLSYVLFPIVAMEFLEEREEGSLEPEPLETPEEALPEAPMPHFAPTEFIATVHGESYKVKIAGSGHKVEGKRPFFVMIDNRLEEVMIETLSEIIPTMAGEVETPSMSESYRPKARAEGDVTTPIPGKVTSIKVAEGDTVEEGDVVLTVEAMKMENKVHTPIAGVVKKILVKIGDSVNPDETLIEIEK